jgi:hypothetical protein
LARRPARFLCRRRKAPLAQQGRGFFEIAVGFGQRGFALHKTGAGPVAQAFDEVR